MLRICLSASDSIRAFLLLFSVLRFSLPSHRRHVSQRQNLLAPRGRHLHPRRPQSPSAYPARSRVGFVPPRPQVSSRHRRRRPPRLSVALGRAPARLPRPADTYDAAVSWPAIPLLFGSCLSAEAVGPVWILQRAYADAADRVLTKRDGLA